VLDRHVPRAFEVIGEMVFQPRFGELETEREVVLEEIAMYEDDPQDKVFDVLGEAVFGAHPLGRAILGRADVVGGTPAADLRAFHRARYLPGNVVVAAAGAIDHDALVALVEASLARGSDLAIAHPPGLVPEFAPRVRFVGPESGSEAQYLASADLVVAASSGQAPAPVEYRGREVAARVEDLGVGGAEHRLAHLLHDRFETMLDDGDRDRIGRHDFLLVRASSGWPNYTSRKPSRYAHARQASRSTVAPRHQRR